MSRLNQIKNATVLICILYSLFSFNTAMATEEPKFNLIEKENSFELRSYQPQIVAEVYVDAGMDESSRRGFGLIADFIFGNNTAQSGKSEKISMTAPVGVKENNKGWKVYFVMPSQYTLDTLPKPNNEQVSIKQVPVRKFAVIRFSGLVSQEKMNQKVKALNEWMVNKNLKPIGSPELARYNPPWTLPFLRRNEVMVEVE